MALGGGGALGFGVIRRDAGKESSAGVLELARGTLSSRGVAADSSPVFSFSSSSSANDSLLLASGFFFFFFLGGPSLCDLELLAHYRQHENGDRTAP